jgi:hypothetical protein
MKTRLFTIALVLILSVSLMEAQTLVKKGKLSFGILGGVNFQNLTGQDHSRAINSTNDLMIGLPRWF